MKKVYLCIQDYNDREKLISALVNSGYTIKMEIKNKNKLNSEYWIILDLPEMNIKDK